MKAFLVRFKKKFDWRVLVLFLPSFIYVCMFTFYPMIKMFLMSFTDWHIGYNQESPIVWFDNYVRVFQDPVAITAIVNTLFYLVITVPLQMAIGLFIALLINKITHLSVTFRVFYYLPVVTSWVVVALLFRYIFMNDGLLNYFLVDVLHFTGEKVGWLSTRFMALTATGVLGIWKGIGWNMVIFLAALQAVPKEYYEAASIDGANAFQKFFYITIPSIRGTIAFALVMLTIGAFNTYTPIAVLTEGNPYHQTEVVLTWMNFKTFSTLDMGYSAALSIILMMMIIITTMVMMKFIYRKGR